MSSPARIEPAPPWQVGSGQWDFRTPLVMGVLNATPDSFSDGGDYLELEAAVARAHELGRQRVDVIDLGGASSHPLARPVPVAEELERVVPVVKRLVREVPLPLSIDTQQPEVAETCLGLGAHLINDVSGLPDPAMARVAARHGVPLVIMYNNFAVPRSGGPETLMEEMAAFFRDRIRVAQEAGASRLILDPGYGFGKTLEENLLLLRSLSGLHALRRPVLICTSRKGSLGTIAGEPDPKQRLGATLASTLLAVQQGVHMIRVHDAREAEQAVRTWLTFRGEEEGG